MRKSSIVLALISSLSCGGGTASTPTPATTLAPAPLPTPTPPPVVAQACPALVASKAYVHLNVGPGEAVLPNHKIGVIGGRMVLDSTFAFLVDGVVVPCNAEHPNCGLPGPQCEDPRGSVWNTVSGDYGFYPDLDPGDFEGESSFAIRIPRDGAFTHRGTAEYQVCPRQDYATANGAPIDITAKRCSKITIEIQ